MKSSLLLITFLSFYTVSLGSKIIGRLDAALTKTDGCTGWAKDKNEPTIPVQVSFYADTIFIGSTLANKNYKNQGSHGFEFTIPEKYRKGTINITAYSRNTKTNKLVELDNGNLPVGIQKNLTYSNYLDYSNHPLILDIMAMNSDEKKPLIVFVFGGGFISGSKEHMWHNALELGNNGDFVTATINYRLIRKSGKSEKEFNPHEIVCNNGTVSPLMWYRAIQDLNSAIKYLLYHKDKYNIDPSKIFLYGGSAGGITTLQLAYTDETKLTKAFPDLDFNASDIGGINHTTDKKYINQDYKISGVATVAGALWKEEFLDSTNNIPTLMIHSPNDNVLPYFKKALQVKECSKIMYGSKYIHDTFLTWKDNGIQTPLFKLFIDRTKNNQKSLDHNISFHGNLAFVKEAQDFFMAISKQEKLFNVTIEDITNSPYYNK